MAAIPSRDVLERGWSSHGGKHTKLRGKDWPAAVRESKARNGDAKYHPNVVALNLQKTLELDTIREEFEFTGPNDELRYFCREVTDLPWGFPLGASDGVETNWIYVEMSRNPQATAHGRPRTKDDLDDMKEQP